MIKMLVRIADNVLEERDFAARRLSIVMGKVVDVELVNRGVYSWDGAPAVGWDMDQLTGWLRHDATGRHPEQYHQVLSEEGLWV